MYNPGQYTLSSDSKSSFQLVWAELNLLQFEDFISA